MPNIADYVSQLQTLTQRNLDLLTAINESFFTKKEHLSVQLGSTQYVIPSFVSLENKINTLQENFDNLVSAPQTGEAVFNIDGNTRRIEMQQYTNTPHRITIDPTKIAGFSVEQNDVFKDFMTPSPYLNIDLNGMTNDISCVNVRKITFQSQVLLDTIKELFPESSNMVSLEWSTLYKILAIYKEDVDYTLYDTLRRLPLRENNGYGTYTIKSIDKDYVDDDLCEYVTLTLHDDLKYTLYDETVEYFLQAGDELVTYDDSAKMEIVSVSYPSRQLTVKILNGDYLNLDADPQNTLSSDMCKLKFFHTVNYDENKYINIPLEEDEYVAVFIAPTNDRLNVRAPWGGGLLLNTTNIMMVDNDGVTFKEYYKENVKNIGDILNEISQSMSDTVTQFSQDEFNNFVNYKPTIDTSTLEVVQINTHLNNSETIRNIRSLYTQKQDYARQLDEVKEKITELTNKINSTSFQSASNLRNLYETNLASYKSKYDELSNSINNASQEIAKAANDSVIPIENAKYHIRGYYDINTVTDSLKDYINNIKGIRVQYRYKNQDVTSGTASTIGDTGFIFSDWNDMAGFDLKKKPQYENGKYSFGYVKYSDTQNTNEPSFNQIDIPISQGETVDMRLKIVWDFGFPFIETTSDWSQIINITFPDEYIVDVQVADIIAENNNDIEDNKFKNLLKEEGVTSHVDDSVTDQNNTYFHQPDHIASGFYTSERRIIPLKDKLDELNTAIQTIQDTINNTNNNRLTVTATINNTVSILKTGKINNIIMPAWSSVKSNESIKDTKGNTQERYRAIVTLQIGNNTTHTAYLYSIFPSNTQGAITPSSLSPYNMLKNGDTSTSVYAHTAKDGYRGVFIGSPCIGAESSIDNTKYRLQQLNQWVTFRIYNPYDASMYYGDDYKNDNTLLSWDTPSYTDSAGNINGMVVFPYVTNEDDLIINNANIYSKLTLAPKAVVNIPIVVDYHFPVEVVKEETQKTTVAFDSISKYISFDLRTSLYLEPVTYTIKFTASQEDDIQYQIANAERREITGGTIDSDALSKYTTIANS